MPPQTASIIDSDGHVVEADEAWSEHLAPRFLDFVPRTVNSVMFASDYPHGDGVFPGAATELVASRSLDEEQRDRVLFRNAERFYRL